MSPIGRTFIVLNLFLAGGFVYFSGVYLQKATDWKAQHDAVQTESSTRITQLEGQVQEEQSNTRDKERQLNASEQAKNSLETRIQELEAENQRNARLLNTIQGDMQTQAANFSTISSSIDTSTREFADASQRAIQSSKERDDAVRAMEVAQADLRDATDRIAALEDTIGENQVLIARLEQTTKEKQVLLDVADVKFPGWRVAAQPQLSGTVERVDGGKLVTILITSDPADAGCKAGYSFAIYDGTNYKGEALVTEVDGKFAFCRVTRSTGREIQAGDQASTLTSSR